MATFECRLSVVVTRLAAAQACVRVRVRVLIRMLTLAMHTASTIFTRLVDYCKMCSMLSSTLRTRRGWLFLASSRFSADIARGSSLGTRISADIASDS